MEESQDKIDESRLGHPSWSHRTQTPRLTLCYNTYMISLNHVLAGTAIGLAVKEPLLAAPLAFLSHFVLDTIPHFQYSWPGWKFRTIWAIDAITSSLALLLLTWAEPSLAFAILVGGVFAELPDVFWLYERFALKGRQSSFWYFKIHRTIQWSETQRGLFYEIGYLAILIALNLYLVAR